MEYLQKSVEQFELREVERVERVSELLRQRHLLMEKLRHRAVLNKYTTHWKTEANVKTAESEEAFKKFVEEPLAWTDKVDSTQVEYGEMNSPGRRSAAPLNCGILLPRCVDSSACHDGQCHPQRECFGKEKTQSDTTFVPNSITSQEFGEVPRWKV